jgi:hypothetical protein
MMKLVKQLFAAASYRPVPRFLSPVVFGFIRFVNNLFVNVAKSRVSIRQVFLVVNRSMLVTCSSPLHTNVLLARARFVWLEV